MREGSQQSGVLGAGPLPGLQKITFSLCTPMVFPGCMSTDRDHDLTPPLPRMTLSCLHDLI